MAKGRPRSQVAPCRYCHKQFKRLEHLQRHERTHTKEKPFVCDCGQRYSRQDLLVRHLRLSSHNADASVNGPASNVMISTPVVATNLLPESETVHNSTSDVNGQKSDWLEHDMHTASSLIFNAQSDQQSISRSHHHPETDKSGSLTIDAGKEGSSNFLLHASDELEFLWNSTQLYNGNLPTDPLDTDFSLADVSQQNTETTRNGRFMTGTLPDFGLEFRDEQQYLLRSPANGDQSRLVSQSLPLESVSCQQSNELVLDNSPDSRNLWEDEDHQSFAALPWNISSANYRKISQEFALLIDILPVSSSLPSRHTLSRFLEGYFRGFHDHMPFLHIAIFSVASLGLEMVLSMAALGALYRFEHQKSYELYRMARTVVSWQLDNRSDLPNSFYINKSPDDIESDSASKQFEKTTLRLLQTLIVLLAVASWGDHVVQRDSPVITSQAAMLAREMGIAVPEVTLSENMNWENWVNAEERRRTLFVVYVLCGLQSIASNAPPMIVSQEVSLNLPASCAAWKAPDALQWSRLRTSCGLSHPPFQKTLDQLLSGKLIYRAGGISSFGNYVLIHGLVQQIFFARNAASCLADSTGALPNEFVRKVESALRIWQESWETNHEINCDLPSPKDHLRFNSIALLRLAYIRLNANSGPSRQLITRDPVRIAHEFSNGKAHVCNRSPHSNRAVLQCIHALSIPVRAGIGLVARTQILNWSIHHSLCNLECAFLLAKWLQTIAECVEASGISTLSYDERKLLRMVAGLVQETHLATSFDQSQQDADRIRYLAVSTVRLWAETFKGSHVFEIVHVIGTSLTVIAEILDA